MSFSLIDLWRRATGATPTPAPVEPAPTVPPVSAPTATPTGLTIEGKAGWFPRWLPQSVPLVSSSPVFAKNATGKTWYRVRITAGDEAVTLSPSVRGPNNPVIKGIARGTHTLRPREAVIIEFAVGPLTVTKSSGWDQSNYGIHIDGVQIVKLSAQVLYSK